MTVKAIMPVRFMNPVEPLGSTYTLPTATRNQDTGGPEKPALWSGAVSGLIGTQAALSLRPVDVDSSAQPRTRATTPSGR